MNKQNEAKKDKKTEAKPVLKDMPTRKEQAEKIQGGAVGAGPYPGPTDLH